MRLTLIIDALAGGGAQRVMTAMANYWANKDWEITILTWDDGTEPPFYKLNPRVCHIPLNIAGHSLNAWAALRNNRYRVAVLRSAVRKSRPDCVISFIDQTNVLTLLATRGLGIPVIVEEHIDVGSTSLGKPWRVLRALTYPYASKVVAVTERGLNGLPPRLRSGSIVIPNPVAPLPNGIDRGATAPLIRRPAAISIGRLVPQKGFDLLLLAFVRLKDRHKDWNLVIIGEGPQRQSLLALSRELGIADRVMLTGQVTNPEDYFTQGDLFIMASRYEGFPMALCEAMTCGLPVVSTDCPSGPREIIRDGVDGVLVPNEDVPALAAAMDRLMSNASERKRLAARAPEITERFSVARVMNMWEQLVAEIIEVGKGK
jgi:glycosyltransferase involved in cell wall biosynthesis